MPATKKQPPANVLPETPPSSEVLTLAEAAAYLRVHEAEILPLVHSQGLPGRKIGDDWRFFKAAIQDWLRLGPTPAEKGFWETHFGALQGDPYLEEMLREVYQQRGRPETEGA